MSVRALIAVLIVFGAHAGAAFAADYGIESVTASAWRFDLGLGLAAQWRREINPQFGEYANQRNLFVTAWYRGFGLGLELGRDPKHDSSSGGLKISTETTRIGAWGRYQYADLGQFTPYVSLGTGVARDQIRTTFQSVVDQRRGSRRFVGLGAGVGLTMYRLVLAEVEGRLLSEETIKFPGFAFVLKLGLTYY